MLNMKSSVHTLTLVTVLGCVMSAERRVNGSEGESVEIKCNYPDGYQYKKKYWCRHPCGNKDVLIKTGKTDTVVSVGRFSLFDNVSSRTFTVTMSRLTLQDTGVYYCGLEQWGTDRLSKIDLRVRKAPAVPTVTPSAPGTVTEEVTATALTASSTTGGKNDSLSMAATNHTDISKQDHNDAKSLIGAALGVMALLLLVAVFILVRQRQKRATRSLDKKPTVRNGATGTEQSEDVAPGVYEEIDAGGARPLSSVYYSVSYHQEEDSQGLYSLAQLPVDIPEDSEVYSFITAH
ncbi:CMRF35-like molecule 5 isoform X2 [Lepisosteus oculatus]|uniref:CMRF35-like molecule 5 isoform X2 n=2 Tax=Lepisosteus oculatus TaxID=7918 RepID=UPI00371B8D9C